MPGRDILLLSMGLAMMNASFVFPGSPAAAQETAPPPQELPEPPVEPAEPGMAPDPMPSPEPGEMPDETLPEDQQDTPADEEIPPPTL